MLEDIITPKQRLLLAKHWSSPKRAATATELACATGMKNHGAVNIHYGRLGKLLRQEMGYKAPGIQSYIISWFDRDGDGHWVLHMHPEIAAALKELGWVKNGVAKRSTDSKSRERKKARR